MGSAKLFTMTNGEYREIYKTWVFSTFTQEQTKKEGEIIYMETKYVSQSQIATSIPLV